MVAYQLGVDVGTSYTAAAVGRDGHVSMLPLGNRTPIAPSVVFRRSDGSLALGESAAQLAEADPRAAAREFKRQVGDHGAVRLGGRPVAAEWLMAEVVRWVADRAAERLGEAPARIVVTHPATWWAAKVELYTSAVAACGFETVTSMTESEAAASAYAANERIEPGRVVVVYDLGGGTFDVALLRRVSDGFELLGRPEGLEHLGGVDFDAGVRAHVNRALGGQLDRYDPTDPTVAAALARLRAECVGAKEALSADTAAVVPVLLPGLQAEVRLTRAEFEATIRPALVDTLGATRRALRSSGVALRDIEAVLLVGGSSRIPLVAQLVAAELGRPIALDAHPKHLVALGAALAPAPAALSVAPGGAVAPVEPSAPVEPGGPLEPVAFVEPPAPLEPPAPSGAPAPSEAPAHPEASGPAGPTEPARTSRPSAAWLVVAALVVLAGIAVVGLIVL